MVRLLLLLVAAENTPSAAATAAHRPAAAICGSFVERFAALDSDRWDWRGSYMLGGHGHDAYMARPDHLTYGRDGLTIRMDSTPCAANTSACCCAGKQHIPCTQDPTSKEQACAKFASGHILSKVSYGYGAYEAEMQFSGAKGAISFWDIGEHELCESPHEETQFYYTGSAGADEAKTIKTGYYTPKAGAKDGSVGHPLHTNLSFDPSQAFHTYRIEWSPGLLLWFVDGCEIRRATQGVPSPNPNGKGECSKIKFILHPSSEGFHGATQNRVRYLAFNATNDNEQGQSPPPPPNDGNDVVQDTLYDALHRVEFRNFGLTLRSHRYAWETLIAVSGGAGYLERENVSLVRGSWGGNRGTHRFLVPTTAAQGAAPLARTPPSGIRSAVPLGGISTGSVELRGDGSFAEWTIQNQSPAGAAKISIYPDALLALRLCGAGTGKCTARLLQTHPKGVAADTAITALPPIDAIGYSGTNPVSRLQPTDAALETAAPGLNTTLFAFSALAVGDMQASARPAIAFTLTLRNDGQQPANASLLLNIPLQIETDQARPGATLVPAMHTRDAGSCAEQCHKNGACNSWNFVVANTSCQLQAGVGLNRYTPGSDSGVRGRWTVDADGRCVTLLRPGNAPTSGHIVLCADSADGSQVSAHSRLNKILNSFGTAGALGVGDSNGQQGTVMVSTTVPPGTNTSISLTMGWRLPNRDWYNFDCPGQPGWWHSGETCGGRSTDEDQVATATYDTTGDANVSSAYVNRYAEIYPTARGAAWAASGSAATTDQRLLATVKAIDAMHTVFMQSTLPDWLQDHLVNRYVSS